MKKSISFLIFALLGVNFAAALDVQTALQETAKQFSATIKTNSVVAIIGVYSDSTEFSEFMYDELTANFVKEHALIIVDRANLEAIKKEMSFQLSGEVGDESIQQFGAKLGVQTVVKGGLRFYGGSRYRLVIRALNVKTAAVADIYSEIVKPSKIELGRLAQSPSTSAKRPKLKAKYSAVGLGFQNMIFGLGSYRAGHYVDGALLTVGHLTSWMCLSVGLGTMFGNRESNPNDFNDPRDYYRAMGNYKRGEESSIRTAVARVITFSVLETISIIYGAVVPYFYEETKAIAKILNPEEDGFYIALGVDAEDKKKPFNLSPTLALSYRINY